MYAWGAIPKNGPNLGITLDLHTYYVGRTSHVTHAYVRLAIGWVALALWGVPLRDRLLK